ncbi:hypothetical protein YK48G_14460 [Lentilactobacillus fungorum]|uniref:DNA-damage-inducible protein J n=1 Tax=Lentilactobacillus fungorum TaxID=2201250 RepID=A0ABQ3W144_9LACO|nr:type II toxin-antitoxin system RelB/DinJ family antitoxin [Lentilactobacillus fungorum]GHP14021.1 hypothetical protein YK48G_14460 [Lentilactobacillus fungorum]
MAQAKAKTKPRINVRIDPDIKQKAEAQLEKQGLTISEFVRATLTSVANEGLPEHFMIPNQETLAGIQEAIDEIKGKNNLPGTSDPKKLLQMLLSDDDKEN